jgi:hypothetical protein
MPKFVIERDIVNVGHLPTVELRGISAGSCAVLKKLGPSIQWVQSYVTNDKIYCIYIAPLARRASVRSTFISGPFTSITDLSLVVACLDRNKEFSAARASAANRNRRWICPEESRATSAMQVARSWERRR